MRHIALPLLALTAGVPAFAQSGESATDIAEIRKLRGELDRQAATIAAQRARLDALEAAFLAQQRGLGAPPVVAQSGSPAAAIAQVPPAAAQTPSPQTNEPAPGIGAVGIASADGAPMPEVAALSDTGGIITRPGRLTLEPGVEYARADRNRVIFRGIEIPQSVLVGAFDINENRQDIITASLGARFGVTSRFELNGRVPFVYRNDVSIIAPAATGLAREDETTRGANIGDIEAGVRYQLNDGKNGAPYLIAAVTAVLPTGTNPFTIPRNADFTPRRAATGGGFYGLTPSLTALLPTDPAVLFATLGYTRNFGRSFDDVAISDALRLSYVKPGDALLGTFGMGVSLNPVIAFSLGYAHNWAFGTRTRGRSITAATALSPEVSTPFEQRLRDLQIGRLIFGISYRTSPRTTINWNVEVGATEDAADVRTTLRVPFSFDPKR